MHPSRVAKKPTISSSFYDSYTNRPVKWYEIVDSYREHKETYLPLRLENYPRDLWENFKKFFQSEDTVVEIDDEEQVQEETQTRTDGNLVKITEYNLANEKFDPKISDAVRTHTEATEEILAASRETALLNKSRSDSQQRLTQSPTGERRRKHRRRHDRHTAKIVPHADCPECRALAAQGFPTLCNCDECRIRRAAYATQVSYCDCHECRNTRRMVN